MMSATKFPKIRQIMPDYKWFTEEDKSIQISDYRSHQNLVLLFVNSSGSKKYQSLFHELNDQYKDFQDEKSEIIIIQSKEESIKLLDKNSYSYPICMDSNNISSEDLGIDDKDKKSQLVIYVLDRFGEIYYTYRSESNLPIPTAEQLLDWVQFIEIQCPECGVSEWV